jgi:hypothetical protein
LDGVFFGGFLRLNSRFSLVHFEHCTFFPGLVRSTTGGVVALAPGVASLLANVGLPLRMTKTGQAFRTNFLSLSDSAQYISQYMPKEVINVVVDSVQTTQSLNF